MPKPCASLSPEDAEQVERNARTRRQYLAREQHLLREIAKTEAAIERTRAVQARSDWDAEHGRRRTSEMEMNRCLHAHNGRALENLYVVLREETEALAQLRAERPRAIYPEAADPKVRARNERARRYREKNREKLAAQARERRARARTVLAVAKGELDIFS